jgi:hypothetical protein
MIHTPWQTINRRKSNRAENNTQKKTGEYPVFLYAAVLLLLIICKNIVNRFA